MKPEETRDLVEFAVKLQNNVLCPIDSYWPIEKYKAIDEAYRNKDKDSLAEARNDLASAFRIKAKKVSEKYISKPKSKLVTVSAKTGCPIKIKEFFTILGIVTTA